MVAAQSLAALPQDDGALYLFAHGAKHGWLSLFWLLDAALLLRALDEERASRLLKRAKALGVVRPLQQGASLAQDILGARVAAGLTSAVPRWLVREPMRRTAQPGARSRAMTELARDTLYLARLQQSRAGLGRFLRRRVSSPENWREFPLPDAWFWLYYPLSPLLWFWRRLRRRPPAGENPPPGGTPVP
jgi:hypothetical protein